MNRLASFAATLLWTALLACSSAGVAPAPAPPPPPPPPPPPCEVVVAPTVTITVDRQANVDRPCIEVQKGNTDIVWTGTSDVKILVIAFKTGSATPPDDPVCAGATCTLEKAKHAMKEGAFDYSVLVVRQNGSTATVDPRLIIKP